MVRVGGREEGERGERKREREERVGREGGEEKVRIIHTCVCIAAV